MPTNQFRNIEAQGVAQLGTISKYPGGQFAANLLFEYQGPGGTVDVGLGFAPAAAIGFQNVTDWFSVTVTLPAAATWITGPIVGVTSTIPYTMALGLKDILKWVQTAGGPRDPGGNGFLIADWDEDVYNVIAPVTEFRNLTAAYA